MVASQFAAPMRALHCPIALLQCHFVSGLSIKVPRRIENIKGFNPMPGIYPDADGDAKFILKAGVAVMVSGADGLLWLHNIDMAIYYRHWGV